MFKRLMRWYWIVVALGLVAFGWVVYQEGTRPLLAGEWTGNIYIYYRNQPSIDPTSSPRATDTLSLKLRFIQGGGARRQSGALNGELTVQGAPWSEEPQTLTFVGSLDYVREGVKVTLYAKRREPREDGKVPDIYLTGFWEEDRLYGNAGLSDLPDDRYPFVQGEWDLTRVR